MRKLIFSLVAVMLIASSAAFAQKTRSAGVYFDATAGNVNASDGDISKHTTAQDLFAGNEFEFGIWYRQNFESVQWLTFQMKALVIATQTGVYEAQPSTDANIIKPNKYKGLGEFGLNTDTPRAQIGLMLNSEALGFDGLYMGLFFDTRTLAAFELFYTLGLGNAGGLTFGAIVEFWANPMPYSIVPAAGGDTKYAYNVLDVFELRIAYSLPFAEIWGFTTQVGFRFQGPGTARPDGLSTSENTLAFNQVKLWEDNFASRLQIRWENTLSVNAGGLGLWARVRYNLNNLAAGEVKGKYYDAAIPDGVEGLTTKAGIMHEVVLQAGLSYSFDLSAL